MTSRKHPIANWLLLPPHEQRVALDKVLAFRDEAADPMASGLPEAAERWFYTEELPRLAQRPDVRRQIESRVDELVAQQSDIAQAMDLRHRALLERLQFLQSEVARLEGVLA